MALDIGEKRIGIAVSENGVLATPHSILFRKSKNEDFQRLQQLVQTLGVEQIIVGLPYVLDGPEEMGPQARRIKRYADRLAENLDIPLGFFDESYSSVDAANYLSAAGRRKGGKRGKIYVDDAAAAVILQNYLDAR